MDLEHHPSLVDILRPILTPLQSLSELATTPITSTKQPQKSSHNNFPRKRPGTSTFTLPTPLDGFLAKTAALREQGRVPDTLFFPEFPESVRDSELVEAVQIPVRAIKRISKKSMGQVLLWMAFFDEGACVEAWKRIDEWRKGRDGFKMPIVHRGARIGDEKGGKSKNKGVIGADSSKKLQAFKKRMDNVLKSGGLGNTLLFRSIPLEVSVEEFEEMVNVEADEDARSVKLRTAEGKGGSAGRNMWVVFSRREALEKRFPKLLGKRVTFRCGKSIALKPMLHNDAGDADTKKRRIREREALEQTPAKTRKAKAGADSLSHKESLQRLEEFLQMKSELCVFMNRDKPQNSEVIDNLRTLWH